jgi:hypothetical protein
MLSVDQNLRLVAKALTVIGGPMNERTGRAGRFCAQSETRVRGGKFFLFFSAVTL